MKNNWKAMSNLRNHDGNPTIGAIGSSLLDEDELNINHNSTPGVKQY